VAEELIYQEVSTGAQDDLMKATNLARHMVRAYGMSDKIGQVSFERDRQPLFLQTDQGSSRNDLSEDTLREIDCEVRRIIDEQHARVTTLLARQEKVLREAAGLLLEKETISGEDLKGIMGKAGAAR
ncbi:MAG: cell division protein FtsH, partial [Nitrospirales bacterium]